MKKNISVCFPVYNEEENIERASRVALSVLESLAGNYEVLIMDDGSSDGTGYIIDDLAKNNHKVRVIHYKENKGYGSALRTLFANAKYDLIFFSDSDGQFDFTQIERLLSLSEEADIVAGYRLKRKDPFYRRLNGLLYNLLIYFLFGLKVRDINCAFKLIKKPVFDDMKLKSTGALINAELLIKAKKRGFIIKQIGVNHFPRIVGKQSGAKLKVVCKMFIELFKLRKELR